MTFRRRIALLAGLSFVAAVVACAVVGYLTVRHEMLDRIDSDLTARVLGDQSRLPPVANPGNRVTPGPGGSAAAGPAPGGVFRPLPTDVLSQTVAADGTITPVAGQTVTLPVDDAELALASQPAGRTVARDVDVDGARFRMVTASTGQGQIVQLARSLAEVDETLRRFALTLLIVCGAGAALAGAVGWAVARRSARPVVELTRAAEHVADTLTFDTSTLDRSARHRHDDEIGRLSTSIAAMLDALRDARAAQHRLVMDASHEFRTPLTALRTNVAMLDHPELDPATRGEVVADLHHDLDDLTALADELVQLATDTARAEEPADVDMADLARRVAERAARRSGHAVTVDAPGEPWVVHGRPQQLERVVHNLVDNATKWCPDDRPIEVRVEPGALSVVDHGPGVPEGERTMIFERFYRTEAGRSKPGSGLGLSIVHQIVTAHGGTVVVDETPGGGATFTMSIPAASATG